MSQINVKNAAVIDRDIIEACIVEAVNDLEVSIIDQDRDATFFCLGILKVNLEHLGIDWVKDERIHRIRRLIIHAFKRDIFEDTKDEE